jgi:response regulator RpfG family c-di-GMP phosphodiesterase/DNA-binding CsgD family transcriptional regulator
LAGFDDAVVHDAFYTTLLQHVGCTAYAHETSLVFGGNDIAIRAGGAIVDFTSPKEALRAFLRLAEDESLAVRARTVVAAVRLGSSFDRELSRANCEVALRLADRIGLEPGVQQGLDSVYERWDGKGHPRHLQGDAIPHPSRLAHVATQAVLLLDLGGVDLARNTIRKRAGGWLDPRLVETFLTHHHDILDDLDTIDADAAALEAGRRPEEVVPSSRLDAIAKAFADMVDVKSPYTHGHSSGVAQIAEAAAHRMGLSESEITAIRRAGYLHDIGHVGTPNGILEKAGPLTSIEWERIRLHPYHAERLLMRSGRLAPLAPLVGMHHERLDGSGYHHHVTGQAIPMGARVIAAANIYQAMCEERPYRPAHLPEMAAAQLRAEARQGLLDGEAVDAVLASAGHDGVPARQGWPDGLTGREVEVLRLASRGLSNRKIGERLSISPKTAGHHIQHIYDKIGVSTRAGAAVYAMEYDLIRTRPFEE